MDDDWSRSQSDCFVLTVAVNVPLNDSIKAAGHPDRIDDLNAVRTRFNEAGWAA